MKSKSPGDPYLLVIRDFNRKGVKYVVVGMSGINFYAKDARDSFSTLDYDFFLEPFLSNIQKAVEVLKKLGFTLGTSKGLLDPADLKKVVREQRTLTATTSDGLMIELLLAVSGYPFFELAKDAAAFTVQGVPVRVGKLSKLLRSKRLADRPKDRQFLQRYGTLFKEEQKDENRTRPEET